MNLFESEMVEVDGGTFFEKALVNYERLERVTKVVLDDAKKRYVDAHIDDKWYTFIFFQQGYKSREECWETFRKKHMSWPNKMVELGYLEQDFRNHLMPLYPEEPNTPSKDKMEVFREQGKCMIKLSLAKTVKKAEKLDEFLEKYEQKHGISA